MPWVDSNINDQCLSGMANPVGYVWDENHPAIGPPGWNQQLFWPWENVRMLLSFIPSRMRGSEDRAVVLMYKPADQPFPTSNPLQLRPVNLSRLMSYCCGRAHPKSCPIGERLVGACSHCSTALALVAILPTYPLEFSTTHQGTRLLDRSNPHQMDSSTVSEMS